MTWDQYHSQSEKYACSAEVASIERDFDRAKHFYLLAAEQEELALAALDRSETRGLGIIAVSAAALWYKAGEYARAREIATRWLESNSLPQFAVHQLQELLVEIERIEGLMKAVEEWRSSVPISARSAALLTKAVEEWKAVVAQ